jgi:type VI secretion system protein VasI
MHYGVANASIMPLSRNGGAERAGGPATTLDEIRAAPDSAERLRGPNADLKVAGRGSGSLVAIRLNVACTLLAITMSTAAAEVSDCVSLEEDLQRLACYDREAGYAPATSNENTAGDWIIRKEASYIDDSINVHLSLTSYDETNCLHKDGHHQLWIACREKKAALYIHFANCYMANSQTDGWSKVTYRIDPEPAAEIAMSESRSKMELGLWNWGVVAPFVEKLLGHDRLVIRAARIQIIR